MAEESAKLRIPYIAASQAQKHVTHNEAMTLLDTLVQLAVLDKDLAAPPAEPAEGDSYIVAESASGAWIGWDGRIARYIDGMWRSYLPGAGSGAGWLAYVLDEATLYVFTGTAWEPLYVAGGPDAADVPFDPGGLAYTDATQLQGAIEDLDAAIDSKIGAEDIVAAAAKTAPHDNDLVGLVDSEASNVLKKLSWANLKTALQSVFRVLTGNVNPATNDGAALGTASLQWSDLFLAEGGVVNWDDGDVTLTQTGNDLRVQGISGGALVLNHSVSANVFQAIHPLLQIYGLGADASLGFARYQNAAGASSFFIGAHSRGTSIGDYTVVQNNDLLMRMLAMGSDGTDFALAADIQFEVDGTPGDNDMPGRILLRTTPDGSQTPVARVRIGNAGNTYLMGISTTASAANAHINTGSSPANEILISTSALKYKRDVEPLERGRADAILQLEPIWYRSAAKADNPDWSWYGLGAEAVAEVDPRLVHWGYDPEDDYEIVVTGEGVEAQAERKLKDGAALRPMGVAYDRLSVLLLDLIKRQDARIAALEQALVKPS